MDELRGEVQEEREREAARKKGRWIRNGREGEERERRLCHLSLQVDLQLLQLRLQPSILIESRNQLLNRILTLKK